MAQYGGTRSIIFTPLPEPPARVSPEDWKEYPVKKIFSPLDACGAIQRDAKLLSRFATGLPADSSRHGTLCTMATLVERLKVNIAEMIEEEGRDER